MVGVIYSPLPFYHSLLNEYCDLVVKIWGGAVAPLLPPVPALLEMWPISARLGSPEKTVLYCPLVCTQARMFCWKNDAIGDVLKTYDFIFFLPKMEWTNGSSLTFRSFALFFDLTIFTWGAKQKCLFTESMSSWINVILKQTVKQWIKAFLYRIWTRRMAFFWHDGERL